MRRFLTFALLSLFASLPRAAAAHGMDVGRAEGQLRGKELFLVVAPPESLFLELDADGDGKLSIAEVQSQREHLERRFDAGLSVTDTAGKTPRRTFFDVSVPTPRSALPASHRYLRFTVNLAWDTEPSGLAVSTDWGETVPLWLEAVRVVPAGPGEWRAVGAAESVVLGQATRTGTLLASGSDGARPGVARAGVAAPGRTGRGGEPGVGQEESPFVAQMSMLAAFSALVLSLVLRHRKKAAGA